MYRFFVCFKSSLFSFSCQLSLRCDWCVFLSYHILRSKYICKNNSTIDLYNVGVVYALTGNGTVMEQELNSLLKDKYVHSYKIVASPRYSLLCLTRHIVRS